MKKKTIQEVTEELSIEETTKIAIEVTKGMLKLIDLEEMTKTELKLTKEKTEENLDQKKKLETILVCILQQLQRLAPLLLYSPDLKKNRRQVLRRRAI